MFCRGVLIRFMNTITNIDITTKQTTYVTVILSWSDDMLSRSKLARLLLWIHN